MHRPLPKSHTMAHDSETLLGVRTASSQRQSFFLGKIQKRKQTPLFFYAAATLHTFFHHHRLTGLCTVSYTWRCRRALLCSDAFRIATLVAGSSKITSSATSESRRIGGNKFIAGKVMHLDWSDDSNLKVPSMWYLVSSFHVIFTYFYVSFKRRAWTDQGSSLENTYSMVLLNNIYLLFF